jgi:hypothetical protein
MPDPDPITQKITDFGKILQQFSLTLIQSIGEVKHQLGILTEKMDAMEKQLQDFKGIKIQLEDFDRFRRDMLDEFRDLKGPIRSLLNKFPDTGVVPERGNSTEVNSKNDIQEIIQYYFQQVESCQNPMDLKKILDQLKEKIYVTTGGHRILIEVRDFERRLKPTLNLDENNFRKELLDKILDWKNQLKK